MQATCKGCASKISKGSMRVGITTRSPRFGYYHRYYHRKCCCREVLRKLIFPGSAGKCANTDAAVNSKLATEIKRQQSEVAQAEMDRQKVVIDTAGLGSSLRNLRTEVGDANGWRGSYYLVFSNKSLDDILKNLPTTRAQFLKCHGLGEKKWALFGHRLVALVCSFKKRQKSPDNSSISSASPASSAGVYSAGRVVASQSETLLSTDTPIPATPSRVTRSAPVVTPLAGNDDEICVGETLTSEQILSRKFRNAEQNGDVIYLD